MWISRRSTVYINLLLLLVSNLVLDTAIGKSTSRFTGSRLERPGGTGEFIPKLPQQTAPNPIINLPLPPLITLKQGWAGPQFILQEIQVVDNRILSASEIDSITSPFVGQRIGASDLEELRQRLTKACIDNGYISSGVVLPDQDVADGKVHYQIIEGRVTEIEVIGTHRLRPNYIRDRLALSVGPPFRINDLGNRLQILAQDPILTNLNIDVVPGMAPGDTKLVAKALESKPFTFTTSISNSQSPDVGAARGDVIAQERGTLGFGELLALRYGLTEGVNDTGVALTIPISSWDTLLHFKYDRGSADVVQANLVELGICSETTSYEIGITQPVYRTTNNTVALGLAFAKRRSLTSLGDGPYSFSIGVVDGQADIDVLRFTQEWQNRGHAHTSLVRSTLSKGLPIWGATKTGVKPDGIFTSWLGQGQIIAQILDDLQWVFRTDIQLADHPLFSMEQFSVGGMNSVRGYRENEIVSDKGVSGSMELRYRILNLSISEGPDTLLGQDPHLAVSLAPFLDAGRAWNNDKTLPSTTLLRSTGIGLRFELGELLDAQFYY